MYISLLSGLAWIDLRGMSAISDRAFLNILSSTAAFLSSKNRFSEKRVRISRPCQLHLFLSTCSSQERHPFANNGCMSTCQDLQGRDQHHCDPLAAEPSPRLLLPWKA